MTFVKRSPALLALLLACCASQGDGQDRDASTDISVVDAVAAGDSAVDGVGAGGSANHDATLADVDLGEAALTDREDERTQHTDASADAGADTGHDTGDGDVEPPDIRDGMGADSADQRVDRVDVQVSNRDAGPYCPTQTPVWTPPGCGMALCGNGHIDRCGDQSSIAESCDTADLGGATCASLGYASGQLGCRPDCDFDISACDDCVLSTHELACARPTTAPGTPTSIALASNGTELGLAWVAIAPNIGGVHFARLRPDLSVISESVCIVDRARRPIEAFDVAIAPSASGWIIAAFANFKTGGELYVAALDAEGRVRTVRSRWPAYDATLAARDGGGPLLVYRKDSYDSDSGIGAMELWAELLDDDGNPTVPARRVLDNAAYGAPAAFVGDGFLLVANRGTALDVARIELDVTSHLVSTVPGMHRPSSYSLMSAGQEARVVYRDYQAADGSGREFWQRIGKDGILAGAPIPLPDAVSGSSRGAVFDGKMVILHGTPSLELLRLDETGATIQPSIRVNQTAYPGSRSIARLGNELFVGWTGDVVRPRLGVARLQPF